MRSLTRQDLPALREAYTCLLRPLDYRDSVEWREAAGKAVARATGADAIGFLLPIEDGPLLVSDGSYERKALDEYGAHFHHHNPVDLRRLPARRKVWVRQELCPTPEFVRSEYYNDWCHPYRNLDSAGMRTRLGANEAEEAFLVLSSRRPNVYRPDSEEVELLTFLQPALTSGTRAALLGLQLRRDWSAGLDTNPAPALLIGVGGRIVHISRSGRTFLASIHDQGTLLGLLRAWAMRFRHPNGDPAPATQTIEWRRDQLLIRAALLETSPLAWREPVLLFTIERRTDPRPSVAELLRQRFRVTARETEVAKLIGAGRTTREIADRLGISTHTVRRHSEHLFSKLGVRRRAEVAALLVRVKGTPLDPTDS